MPDHSKRFPNGQTSIATLGGWYRDREQTGHPEAAGKSGRSLAWDAAEWDAWFTGWRDTTGLVDLDALAALVGRSRATLAHLWEQRDTNGHPAPHKRIDGAFYWDPTEYRTWFENEYPIAGDRALAVDFSGTR
jgi:predicted DNA-binding transcriptional regulator AlpA